MRTAHWRAAGLAFCLAGTALGETVTIGENSEASGLVSGTGGFASDGVITCRIGLFLARLEGGQRRFHFAHAPETPIGTPGFQAFLRHLDGGPFTALIFLPAKSAEALGEGLRETFGRVGGRLELVPYPDTEVYEGFKFLATLRGPALRLAATDGRQPILREIRLDE